MRKNMYCVNISTFTVYIFRLSVVENKTTIPGSFQALNILNSILIEVDIIICGISDSFEATVYGLKGS